MRLFGKLAWAENAAIFLLAIGDGGTRKHGSFAWCMGIARQPADERCQLEDAGSNRSKYHS